jgi:hypothetical protein
VRRDGAVEADLRRVEVPGRLVDEVADGDLLAHRLLDQTSDPVGRLHPDVDQPVERLHLSPRGIHADEGPVHIDSRRTRLGRGVEQDLADPRSGHAVDHRVVHLGHDSDPTALETFDEPQFPQRFGAIQLVGHQPADEVVELRAPAGRGHPDPTDVEVDVDVLVLDEVGPVESERRPLDPPPQLGKLGESADDQLANPIEAEVRCVRRVQHRHRADVHMPFQILCEPEGGVDAG